MGNRIKQLRKWLGLTQQKFADCLGVKPNTIAQYEIGRNAPVDSVISLICREFNVNEEWLRTGEGEMFVQKKHQPLDELLDELLDGKTVTDEDKILMKNFLELPDGSRKAVIEFVQTCSAELSAPVQPGTSEQKQAEPDLAEKVAELERQNQELADQVSALRKECDKLEMEAAAELSPGRPFSGDTKTG